jgi:outer membrane protein TolC
MPLTLDEAMSRARETTAEARASEAGVAEAGARVAGARSGFWPRVDVSETIQRGDQPVFVFGSLLSQRRFTAANFAIPALNNPDAVTNTRTAVAVQQPVFDARRTRLGVERSKIDRALAAATRDATRQDLGKQAAQAFVRVLELESMVRASDAGVSAAASDRDRVRVRREQGLVTEADVLAVDVYLATMRQQQIEAMANLAIARLQLNDAVGLPLTTAVEPVRPDPRPAALDQDALVKEALASHPSLREADARLALAENARRTARAALLPTIEAQAGWESNGSTFGSQQSSWMVGTEIRVNVFRGFADTARIAEAQQAAIRATAEREHAARRIELAVRSACEQLAAARAGEEAGRTALAQARESRRILRDRYDSGLATVTDVLRAEETTLDAESRSTAAEMNVVLATVALDRAVGRR